MNEQPLTEFRLPIRPGDMDGLIAFWDFSGAGKERAATEGEPYVLTGNEPIECVDAPGAPFGPKATHLREGQWFSIPRAQCPKLDIHGPKGHLTVMAWIQRFQTSHRGCEFIAGQWNETNCGRQYGLFLNLQNWRSTDEVGAHVSRTGTPTTGYKYCYDHAVGATKVVHDQWHSVAMTYDGVQAVSWLDGMLDWRPGVNPYLFPGGLHDGGAQGSDFTVGAVHRSGEMGNFFTGLIGGLAIYNRALTAAEIFALHDPLLHPRADN